MTDAKAAKDLAEKIHQDQGVMDLLFNNAGIGVSGDFFSIPNEIWQKIFAINIMGIVNCSNAFVPSMIKRGQGGHVINIASTSGYFPGGNMAPYVATKHAAIGISGCQRLEWDKHHIKVTAVCPGVINTNILKNMLTFGRIAESNFKEKAQKVYVKRGYSPDKVAKVVLKKLPKSPYILPVSPEAWVFYFFSRFKPSSMFLQKIIGMKMGKRV